ncbi:PD40 domain-containing protein [Rhodanobacter sp. L36]|uniref:PD40 domain-containing protein n=1 Tax=Rhodanobacter sp. L36 TaxID=1747221 RepID=UPI00131A9EDF|nr:PD40 domain-containing protein [Rhodanobacter sp. L36]
MPGRTLFALLGVCLLGIGCNARTSDTSARVSPTVFAPDVISAPGGVDCLTFTPDGNTVYFDQETKAGVTIMVSHRVAGTWLTPQVATFSGIWMDHDPVVSPEGSFIVFTSNRPDSDGGQPLHGGHLWRVDRQGDGWAKPTRFPDTVNATTRTFAPTIAANGDVYFQQADPPGHDFRLYRTAYRNGSYLPPTLVELGDANAHKLDPAIAPDGSFIVFDANYAGKGKPDRLYIAFRKGGRWSAPVDMGDALNPYQPWGSHLSPDHRTLYFTSDHALPGAAIATAANRGSNHIWSVPLAPWLRARP